VAGARREPPEAHGSEANQIQTSNHQPAEPERTQPNQRKHNPMNTNRRGKIARLPKATRDMINHMLDDGLPYPVIIDELGEAGEGLNAQNLTNWKNGGYRDYVKAQETIACAKAQAEVAAEILRETEGVDSSKILEACRVVAAVQLMDGLLEYGEDALKKILLDNPNRYISILNVVCNLANSGLRIDKFKREVALAKTEAPPASTA